MRNSSHRTMKRIARKCRPFKDPVFPELTPFPMQSKLCDFLDVCGDELQLAAWEAISFIQRREFVPTKHSTEWVD